MKLMTIFLLLICHSQNGGSNDVKRMGLNGKVKEMTEINHYSTFSSKDIYHFNKKGDLVKKVKFDSNVDIDGNTSYVHPKEEIFTPNSNGTITYQTLNNGIIESRGTVQEISENVFKRFYEEPVSDYSAEMTSYYDSNSNLVKFVRKGLLRSDSIHIEMTFKYNENKLVEIFSFDKKKNIKESIILKNCTYDEMDNLLKVDYYTNEHLSYSTDYQYVYY